MQRPSFPQKHPRMALWLAYTALFALLMGVWMTIFAHNGKTLIWYGDATKQHYIALMYYGRWLRGAARALLTGAAIPTYDFSIGYGADIVSTLSYYGFGDPLALTAALVPSEYTEQLLVALSILRIYLAGLVFLAFSRYHGNGRFGTLLGAVAYAFCAWSIHLAGVQPNFLIPMYCFPLMLLGADRIFDGRRPTLYIAAVALAALSNFLFFYMSAVLLVLYAVAKYFRRYGTKQLRTLPPLVGRFLLYSMVGIAMAGITLVPTLLEMFGGVRFGLERQVVWYPFDDYFQALANLTTADMYDQYCSFTGITAPAVLAVMVLFVQKRRDGHLKLAWLTLFAFVLIPWAGAALNGFTYMQNRWVWAFALLEAFIFARVCPRMTALPEEEQLPLIVVLAGYCLLSFWNADARTEWALLGAVLLLLLAVCLLSGKQLREGAVRTVLLAGCCLGVILNLGYEYGQDESAFLAEFRAPGDAWALSVEDNPAGVLKAVEDGGFWRYDSAFNEFENTAMLMQLHGTGYFWSLHNSFLSTLMAELGQNIPKDYEYKGLDGRAPLEALFGVKYYLAGTDRSVPLPAGVDAQEILALDAGDTTVRVCRNEAALPIGFTAGEYLSRARYDALSPVQRQDALLHAVLLEDDAAAVLLPAKEPLTRVQTADAAVTLGGGVRQMDGMTFFSPASGGTITFAVPRPPEGCETYLVVQGMDYTAVSARDAVTDEELAAMSAYDRNALEKHYAYFWGNDHTYLRLLYDGGEGMIEYYAPSNQYYCGRRDFVYAFGRSDAGPGSVTVVLAYAGYYHFDSLSVEYQPTADIVEYTAPRRQECLQNVVLGANSLAGDITVSGDKVLVLQVPWSAGWRAFVDGQPAQLLRADTAFLGLALTAGEHTVELRYATPGLAAGGMLTLAGLAAFLLIALTGRDPAGRKRR